MSDWPQPPFRRLRPFLVVRRITPRRPHLLGAHSGSPAPVQYAGQKWASGRCPYRAEGVHGDESSPENVKKWLSLPCFPRFLPSFAAMVPCTSFDIRISCIVLSITPAQVRYERGQGLCLHSGGVLPLGCVGAAGQPILHRGTDAPSVCEASVKRK